MFIFVCGCFNVVDCSILSGCYKKNRNKIIKNEMFNNLNVIDVFY